jgi:hypothetical protein
MTKFSIIKEKIVGMAILHFTPKKTSLLQVMHSQPASSWQGLEHLTAFQMLCQPFGILCEYSSSKSGYKAGDSVYRSCAI